MVEITREHMAFVERIAWKHSVPENFDDLCGYGMIGLVQAARRFDPSEGPNFLAYASRRIRGAVIDGARELDRLSRRDRHRDDELGDLARSRAGGALELDVPTACEDGEAENLRADRRPECTRSARRSHRDRPAGQARRSGRARDGGAD